eukprot:TRINITY_DN3089_c0_g4_i1.p2 TRINITY_DN3089_c0_g4~~TRINITY_DN3089_c0_g4_i1.p2  ORF type:complete len:239 (-),score=107.71 TRINITY_DN3089_c0_g4_i1:149-865(-)
MAKSRKRQQPAPHDSDEDFDSFLEAGLESNTTDAPKIEEPVEKVDEESEDEEIEEEIEEEEEEEEEDDDKEAVEEKVFANDEEALKTVLGKFGYTDKVDWLETLQLSTEEAIQEKITPETPSLEREFAFYNSTLDAVKRGYNKLDKLGVPYVRPADYYAEMLKTDKQMERVKRKLVTEKQNIEDAQKRTKLRHLKKFGKKIQQQKRLDKQAQKKKNMGEVNKLKKEIAKRDPKSKVKM